MSTKTKKLKLFFLSKESDGGTTTFLDQMDLLNSDQFKKYYFFFKLGSLTKKNKNYRFFNLFYPVDPGFSFNKIRVFFTNIRLLIKTIVDKNPDIVFACDPYSLILLTVVKIFLPKKIVTFALINNNYSYIIDLKPGWIFRKILCYLVSLSGKNIDNFIFVSERLLEDFLINFRFSKKKCVLIHHSTDLLRVKKLIGEKMNGVEKKLLVKKSQKVFYVGQLNNQKDVFTILKAFQIIRKLLRDAELFLIGDGDLRHDLERYAKKLVLGDSIKFLGWKKNPYKFLKYADVFLYSSFYDGLPMAILEALAVGVPIVSTDTPFGPSEILANGKYGFLVSVGDYQLMADKTIKLLKSKTLRSNYSSLSTKRSKNFDVKPMLAKYNQEFKKCV